MARLGIVAVRLLSAATAAAWLTGCMQSAGVGDLGRPGPAAQPVSSYFADERTRGFNETDQERVVHDRIWRFLHADHSAGWFPATLPVARKGATPAEIEAARGDYYRWLSRAEYRSSRTRFATIADDIGADLATLPATFDAICAVVEVDRQRGIAVAELGGLDAGVAAKVGERRARNRAAIRTFSHALAFRFDSYALALDHLVVETPHAEAVAANRALEHLAVYVERAEAEHFCGTGAVQLTLPENSQIVPGRIHRSTSTAAGT